MLNENITKSNGLISKWLLIIGGIIVLGAVVVSVGSSWVKKPTVTPTFEKTSTVEKVSEGEENQKVISTIQKELTEAVKKVDKLQSIVGCPKYPTEGTLEEKLDVLLVCFGGTIAEEEKPLTELPLGEKPIVISSKEAFIGVKTGNVWYRLVEARNLGNILQGSECIFEGRCPDLITIGKFIKVILEEKNLGKETVSFDFPMKAIDKQGRVYSVENKGIDWIPREDRVCGELKPDFPPEKCAIIFEVGVDSTNLKLKFEPLVGHKGFFMELGI